jgi:hypothetical protein
MSPRLTEMTAWIAIPIAKYEKREVEFLEEVDVELPVGLVGQLHHHSVEQVQGIPEAMPARQAVADGGNRHDDAAD